ncbi:uncharacterized protein LOC127095769 [Lathyrus oleraceus]|uniref:uncharacterized protein LOC127095769 n=1 Tax=Pisum sativum TaxID=3888 RepID=UPI0021D378A3|nr:uncharacterized protein LOC127095769 [Pisum sativum]
MVTTEKSIATLSDMEKSGGRRIYNINPRKNYMSQEVIPTIFSQNPKGKTSKNKELYQYMRVSLKIILGTIHHRPASISYDYINTDQKCILYCLHKDIPNPPSPTLAELQAIAESKKTQYVPKPFEPIPPPSKPTSELYEPTSQPYEPDLTFPTIDEVFAKFSENSASRLNDNPSEVRLAQEAAERARREAKERAAAKEAIEKSAAEAEAKEKADAEATLVAKAARKSREDAEKANEVALTRGESSTSDLTSFVLKTLEELQK